MANPLVVSLDNEVNALLRNLPWGYRTLWWLALNEAQAWRRFYFRMNLFGLHFAVNVALWLGFLIGSLL